MKTALAILATTLSLLLLPAAQAHVPAAQTETTPPLGECSGPIDFACFHWDCNLIVCIHLFCPVFIGPEQSHSGGSFGCTPH